MAEVPKKVLKGKIALVAGATRGAGRVFGQMLNFTPWKTLHGRWVIRR